MRLTESKLKQLIREEAQRLFEAREIMSAKELNSYGARKRIGGYKALGRYKIVFIFGDGTTLLIDAKGFSADGRARISNAEDLGSFAEGSGIEAFKMDSSGQVKNLKMKFGDGTVVTAEDVIKVRKPNLAIDLEEHFNSINRRNEELEFNVRAEEDRDHGRLVGTLNGTDITIRKLRRVRGGGWKGTVEIGGETFEVQSGSPNQFALDVGEQAQEFAGGFLSSLGF